MKCALPLCLVAVTASLFSTRSDAGTLTLFPAIVAAYSDDGLFTPVPLPDFQSPLGPLIYEVALSFEVTHLEPSELGVRSIGYNINLDNLTEAGLGFDPDSSSFDLNGPAPGGIVPKYEINQDIGPSTSDLKAMFLAISGTDPLDPRVLLGQGTPSYVGSVYVRWDGQSVASFTIEDATVLFKLTSGGVSGLFAQASTFVAFIPVPEPPTSATCLVVASGSGWLRSRRTPLACRRQS